MTSAEPGLVLRARAARGVVVARDVSLNASPAAAAFLVTRLT